GLAGEYLAASGDRFLPESQGGREEGEGDADRRVAGFLGERLAVELVRAAERPAGDVLLGLAVGVGARTVHARERVTLAPLEQPHGLLVLEAPGVPLECLLEAFQGAPRAVLLEVAQAELERGFFGVGLQAPGLLELLDGAADLPLLPEDRSEQHVGGREGSGLERARELLFGFRPPRGVGVGGARCEGRT